MKNIFLEIKNNTITPEVLKFALKDNFDFDYCDDELIRPGKNRTSIYWAIYYDNCWLFKQIVKNKPNLDLNKEIYYEDNPLKVATKFNSKRIINYLIRAGVDLNKQNKVGDCPIIGAVCDNQLNLVKQLIKAGANVDVSDKENNTPLFIAAHFGHEEMFNYLLKKTKVVNYHQIFSQCFATNANDIYIRNSEQIKINYKKRLCLLLLNRMVKENRINEIIDLPKKIVFDEPEILNLIEKTIIENNIKKSKVKINKI